MKIKLCAFADEAATEFGEQLKVLREENIPYIELRGCDGKNVADLSEADAHRYKEMLDASGVRVWAIGSPLGKIGSNDDFSAHLQKAEHVFRLAKIFGTEKVRVFSFYTNAPEKDEQEVLARMTALADTAMRHGVVLYHENEKEIYGDIAIRCARLLNAVPTLKCVFDPANFVQCNEKVDNALKLLEDKIDYYHIKDALADGSVVPAGKGDGRVSHMIAEIQKDTVLTVEPHLVVFDGYAALDNTQLKNKYAFPSPRTAFSAAVSAVRDLLRENNYHEEKNEWIK